MTKREALWHMDVKHTRLCKSVLHGVTMFLMTTRAGPSGPHFKTNLDRPKFSCFLDRFDREMAVFRRTVLQFVASIFSE